MILKRSLPNQTIWWFYDNVKSLPWNTLITIGLCLALCSIDFMFKCTKFWLLLCSYSHGKLKYWAPMPLMASSYSFQLVNDDSLNNLLHYAFPILSITYLNTSAYILHKNRKYPYTDRKLSFYLYIHLIAFTLRLKKTKTWLLIVTVHFPTCTLSFIGGYLFY